MSERDTSPIDQRWIQTQCDTLMAVARGLDGPMRDATLMRVEIIMDFVDAWQKRKWPEEER